MTRLLRARESAGGLNPAQWEALRYLARCNRFSNSPLALARYVGATKGTVSQTVIALERKGLVKKTARGGPGRAVALGLTKAGRKVLKDDPWQVLVKAIDALGGKAQARLARSSGKLHERIVASVRATPFGECRSCRFFREKGAEGDERGPHQCMLFAAPLSKAESRLICCEFEPG